MISGLFSAPMLPRPPLHAGETIPSSSNNTILHQLALIPFMLLLCSIKRSFLLPVVILAGLRSFGTYILPIVVLEVRSWYGALFLPFPWYGLPVTALPSLNLGEDSLTAGPPAGGVPPSFWPPAPWLVWPTQSPCRAGGGSPWGSSMGRALPSTPGAPTLSLSAGPSGATPALWGPFLSPLLLWVLLFLTSHCG